MLFAKLYSIMNKNTSSKKGNYKIILIQDQLIKLFYFFKEYFENFQLSIFYFESFIYNLK